MLKRELTECIANFQINKIFNTAMSSGAYGGKLLGAGAGGCMAFVAPQERHLN